MFKKSYSKTGNSCRVTFKMPAELGADSVALCGEFNNWDPKSHIMRKLRDGSYSVTLTLKTGQTYRFRYLLDGAKWENDWEADAYIPNDFGTEDSVVSV